MKFITDTHSLFWYLEKSPRLSEISKKLFDNPEKPGTIIVPSIVLAELIYVLRKLNLTDRTEKILDFLEEENRFEIYPLSFPIIRQMTGLDQFEIHDASIVATALHLDLPLMTADAKIVSSSLVQTLRP
ncbi:MAG: PIN domain-containing protein [Deltaproteobacteria bacterium]|nr:PIN domain-containing protein [Deltaproteobacteria bacterium]